MSVSRSVLSLAASVLVLAACSGEETEVPLAARDGGTTIADAGLRDGGRPPPDPTEAVFAADHLIEVDIQLDADDWNFLRTQARSFADLLGESMCIDAPPTSPYEYVPSRVTIDGQTFDEVGVRKKGFFGSVNPIKPSLKLKFDEYIPTQEFSGFERMTFNNARQGQERSWIRQCLAYRLFAAAGIVSPRCNYAHISVNGEDLGVFVHIEAIKKRFLGRFFEDREGALYEGALSDFRPVFVDTFERKTNESIVDRSDLEAVATALTADDADLLDQLAPIVDIDEFLAFWALEVIIGHWDGYTGRNNNNFYVYNDPATGKFHFVPWGVDSVFGYGPPDAVEPVFAYSLLARRLYLLPETRAQFLTRVTELLETVWNDIDLLTQIREIEDVIQDAIHPTERQRFTQTLAQLRGFVQTRKSILTSQLAGGGPEWTRPLGEPLCLQTLGELSGDFQTTWGTVPTNNPFATGSGTFTATVSEQQFTGVTVSSGAGVDENGNGIVQVVAALPGNTFAAILFYMPPDRIVAGTTVDIAFGGTAGGILYYFPMPGAQAQQIGSVGTGRVVFEAASTEPDAPITGRFDGVIWGNF